MPAGAGATATRGNAAAGCRTRPRGRPEAPPTTPPGAGTAMPPASARRPGRTALVSRPRPGRWSSRSSVHGGRRTAPAAPPARRPAGFTRRPVRSPYRWTLQHEAVLGYGLLGWESVLHARMYLPERAADTARTPGTPGARSRPAGLVLCRRRHRYRRTRCRVLRCDDRCPHRHPLPQHVLGGRSERSPPRRYQCLRTP